MITLGQLEKFAADNNIEIHVEKIMSDSYYRKLRLKEELEDYELIPVMECYGLKINKTTYIWFQKLSTDTLYFDHFYNAASGVKQKGHRRYFNWAYKNNLI